VPRASQQNSRGRLPVLAAAFALAPCLALAAAPAPSVRIVGAAARVMVIPEARADVAVQIAPGRAKLPPLKLRRQGGGQVVEGGVSYTGGGFRMFGGDGCDADKGQIRYKGQTIPVADLPVVTVRMPAQADVAAEGMIFGQAGPSQRLTLASKGCGTWRVGPSAGDLTIDNGGAADVQAAGVKGALTIKIDGPGDVAVASGWAAVLTVRSKGPGDISYRGETGRADIQLDGKGDVILGKVFGYLNARVPGSGNFKYARK